MTVNYSYTCYHCYLVDLNYACHIELYVAMIFDYLPLPVSKWQLSFTI